MLQMQDIHYSVGGRTLLSGITWAVQPGKRAALIGPNGAGKTTLFRILMGELTCAQGRVVKPRDYRIGYLPQEEISVPGDSVLSAVLEGQHELAVLEKKIEDLRGILQSSTADHDFHLKKLGDLEHRYEILGGYRVEINAKAILSGLGFSAREFHRPLVEFSGGWRMRAYLARLLVQEPNLLLLDEPTNHLDLPSLEWLEQYLLQFRGSMILVSHDRYFVDRLAQEIYELDRGKIERYPGSYHIYEKQKEQREQLLLKKWEEQQEEIARQERFIQKFRAKATKAAQVQSRIRQLEKLQRVEIPPPPPRLRFRIRVETQSYKEVLDIRDMSFRYDGDWVLRRISLLLLRGEKAALVGPNGAGKTTLTKLIAGELNPQEGTIRLGQRTKIGYYAQHQALALNLRSTVYDEVASTAADSHIPRIRDVLAIFQFSGDDVFKRIEVLSGGEKARVSLAKILLSPVNFLIMDEPTNHLDTVSIEALENALGQYEGTLLVISHDRYFLDKLVSRVFELREGRILEYYGNYSYYLEKRKQVPMASSQNEDEPSEAPGGVRTSNELIRPSGTRIREPKGRKTKEQKRQEAEARQAVSQQRHLLAREIQVLEDQIERLESRKKEIEEMLTKPETYQDSQTIITAQKEYSEIKRGLEKAFTLWEKDKQNLENLLRKLS